MKKLFLYLTFTGLMASCADHEKWQAATDHHENAEGLMEKWTLVEMSGQIAHVSPTTGDDMLWQEIILLFDDGTFQKTRSTRDTTLSATGEYQYEELSDGKYLRLLYPADHPLIGNCSVDFDELYKIRNDQEMLGTWWACDGPGLLYRKEVFY